MASSELPPEEDLAPFEDDDYDYDDDYLTCGCCACCGCDCSYWEDLYDNDEYDEELED